jgi:hypothetical protein
MEVNHWPTDVLLRVTDQMLSASKESIDANSRRAQVGFELRVRKECQGAFKVNLFAASPVIASIADILKSVIHRIQFQLISKTFTSRTTTEVSE